MLKILVKVIALLALRTQARPSDESSITSTPSSLSATRSSTSSSSSEPVTHTVAVGASGHRFTEPEVFAEVGDTVEFIFYPANHSVIRAEYGFPCIPYELHGIGRQGFFSGFEPVRAITHDAPRWSVKINDTSPIFYYCGADGSCYRHHMIGVINPNKTRTLKGQLKAAEGLTFQVLPGEPFPEESGHPQAPVPSPTPPGDLNDGEEANKTDEGASSGENSLGAGAIAGIVIGGVALILLVIGIIYLCGRRRGMDRAHRRDAFTGPPPAMSEANYAADLRSPGLDSRWSMAAAAKEPYRDQQTPARLVSLGGSPVNTGSQIGHGYAFPHMNPQQTGNSQYTGYTYDPRMSHTGSPPPRSPPLASPLQTPVELPSEANPRYSWAGHDMDGGLHTSR